MAVPAGSLIADLQISIEEIRALLATKSLTVKPRTDAIKQDMDSVANLVKTLSLFLITGQPVT